MKRRNPVCGNCGGMLLPEVGCYRCRAREAEAKCKRYRAALAELYGRFPFTSILIRHGIDPVELEGEC